MHVQNDTQSRVEAFDQGRKLRVVMNVRDVAVLLSQIQRYSQTIYWIPEIRLKKRSPEAEEPVEESQAPGELLVPTRRERPVMHAVLEGIPNLGIEDT